MMPGSSATQFVLQGGYLVSRDPGLLMTTVLGSCVAACLFDPAAGIGGMNHFVLPGERATDPKTARFGVQAMADLIEAMVAAGAHPSRLQAKLFGGARMMGGLPDVGARNATFATDFLQRHGIAQLRGSLGGQQGRKIRFHPVTGRAQQLRIPRAFGNEEPSLPPAAAQGRQP